MIDVQNIHKSFGKQHVLKGLDFSVNEGQALALMGPNGSGKTTLIKCILGLVRPDKGDILMHGNSLLGNWSYRENIGYMPQAAKFPERITVKELFSMMKDMRGKQTSETDNDLFEEYGLDSILDKKIGTLSGGTKQKVSAALAFLFNPKMLILDEPTTGLDPLSSEILKKKIIRERNNGKLIFITSHIMSDVEEVSTHVMYLNEGKVEFIKAMSLIKKETGEASLNKAIVRIMTNQKVHV
jgi:Cu-processing system ATP-binding protein